MLYVRLINTNQALHLTCLNLIFTVGSFEEVQIYYNIHATFMGPQSETQQEEAMPKKK